MHQHLQNIRKGKIIFDCFQGLVSTSLAFTLHTPVNISQGKKVNFRTYLRMPVPACKNERKKKK